MTIKLTDRFLTSRKAPLTGRAVYTDTTVPGLEQFPLIMECILHCGSSWRILWA